MNKKKMKAIKLVLEQSHKKIKLYYERNNEYVGGIPAYTLIQNINDALFILEEELEK